MLKIETDAQHNTYINIYNFKDKIIFIENYWLLFKAMDCQMF